MDTQGQLIQKMIQRMPKFMHPEIDRIETLADLEYQISVEINVGESGSTDPRWTRKQIHQAKMYAADVRIAGQEQAAKTRQKDYVGKAKASKRIEQGYEQIARGWN